MRPIRLEGIGIRAAGSDEELAAHIKSALSRNLPELHGSICSHDGTLVIVGSGPTLPGQVDAIRAERERGRPILACNGAHDLLCSNGLRPNIFLSVDPRDTVIPNVSLKNQDTIYLLASRCNPGLFDHLRDCRVMLWHSWSPGPEVQAFKGHVGIGGGTTSGMRAIHVGYVMGFRNFALYGMDSCLADDKLTKRFSGEKAKDVIDVIVGGRAFWCNPAMAQQAAEFQQLYSVFNDIHIESFGDGLITAIIEERKKQGMPS